MENYLEGPHPKLKSCIPKLIMKTIFFLCCTMAFALGPSKGFSQNAGILITKEKAFTVKQIFKLINKQTDYKFIYQYDLVRNAPGIILKKGTIEAGNLLKKALLPIGLDYEYKNNGTIVVIKGQSTAQYKKTGLQQKIKGQVIDNKGAPLAGASILEKGTIKGTQTDFDGNFSLEVSGPNATLVVSYVGYTTREIIVGTQTTLTIKMEENSAQLDEVVIVGYGTQKKTNLTGAVADVNIAKDIGDRPVPNISSMLQGSLPGLTLSTNNSGGEPGSTLGITIRGAGTITGNGGTPYILVDGFPFPAAELNTLNPEDIENVSILKDAASAAIYGSKGAYGVILITTKSGKTESPFRVEYSSSIQFSSPTVLPEMMNSLDAALMINEAQTNSGQAVWYTPDRLQRIQDYLDGKIANEAAPNGNNRWGSWSDGYANNDWYKIYFRDNAPRMKHNLSISGGEKNTNYFLSGAYFDQEGQFNFGEDRYQRSNITANITSKANDWLKFNVIAKYSKEVRNFPSGGFGNFNKDIIYHQISRDSPLNPLYDPEGNIIAPNALRSQDAGEQVTTTNTSFFNFSVDFEPIKDWITRVSYSKKIIGRTDDRQEFGATAVQPDGFISNYGYSPTEIIKNSRSAEDDLFNIVSTLTRTVADNHNFSLMAGYEQRLDQYWNIGARRTQLLTENIPTISTAVGDFIASDALGAYSTQGFFSRFTYNFKEKYLLELNARTDGSSYFSEGNRWGFFPSASASYVVSREDFFEPLSNTINLFKLRGSWGQLGNHDPSLANNYTELLGNGRSQWLFNGQQANFITPPGIISQDLTWETVTSTNVGIDLGMFNNRLNMSFDIFQRVTSDMIGPSEATPSALGTSPPRVNNAELTTKGWEYMLRWKDKIGELNYNITFNLDDNQAKITKYNNPTGTFTTWREGQKLGEIWGYETVGYFESDADAAAAPDQSFIRNRWGEGDIQYADLDGSGAIDRGDNTVSNPGDRKIIGNSRARYNYGLNLGANYKGFNLSILFQGVAKRDYFFSSSTNLFWNLRGNIWQGSYTKASQDYWTPDNRDAYYPKPYINGEHTKNTQFQTKYLQNAAYLRLKNIQLGYTIPQRIMDKIAVLHSVNFYLSGDNLWTKTKLHKNFDPETLGGGWGGGKIYPPSKVYAFGMKLTF